MKGTEKKCGTKSKNKKNLKVKKQHKEFLGKVYTIKDKKERKAIC